MTGTIIELWDEGTFDAELLDLLDDHADLLRSYAEAEQAIFQDHDVSPAGTSSLLGPSNPFAAAYLAFEEEEEVVAKAMRTRTTRAFHYTRMTDGEVAALLREGIHLSTPETLRRRLDACLADGLLTASEADAIVAASPFRKQRDVRAGRFWLASHPQRVDDLGVALLLRHWGGEVAYMWLEDEALVARVQAIGRPRVIEVAVPLCRTTASGRAAASALATFSRALGWAASEHAVDICVTAALPPEAVLAVHSEGETAFGTMGRGYPVGFVEVSPA